MDTITLALVAGIAFATTVAALLPRTNEVVWGAISSLAWVVMGLGATNVEIFEGGSVYTRSYPAVAFIGAAFIVLNVVVVVFGTAYLLDPRDTTGEQRPPV